MAPFGLLIQTAQLHVQNGALPFAEPVVGAINEVAIEPLAGHAATVVHRACLHFKFIAVGNNHSAFAGGDQLAGLKTESSRNAKGAHALSTPLRGVCMR